MKEKIGRTKKPCPGCGEVVPYRKVNDICNKCKTCIQEGRARGKAILKARENKKLSVVQVHWLPSIHEINSIYDANGTPVLDNKFSEHLKKTFISLAQAVSEPGGVEAGSTDTELLVAHQERAYGCPEANRTMPPAVLALFQELYACIITAAKNAYANGEERARDYFQSIVAGKVSLSNFAEYMKLNPSEIDSRIIFSPTSKPPYRVAAMLCELGQLDAQGAVVSDERLASIEKAYREKGVAVERRGNQLWSITTLNEAQQSEFTAALAENASGSCSMGCVGETKEGDNREPSSNS